MKTGRKPALSGRGEWLTWRGVCILPPTSGSSGKMTEVVGICCFRKRSACKDSNPGCWDISSAGHVEAGNDYLPAALRELSEEIGIRARAEELHFVGMRRARFEDVFYGRPFRDNELSAIYIYREPVDEKPSRCRPRRWKRCGGWTSKSVGGRWKREPCQTACIWMS